MYRCVHKLGYAYMFNSLSRAIRINTTKPEPSFDSRFIKIILPFISTVSVPDRKNTTI